MNFTRPDGSPAIPELTWGYGRENPDDPDSPVVFLGPISGYAYFWILTWCIVVLAVGLYMAMGLIPTPVEMFAMIKEWWENRKQRPAQDAPTQPQREATKAAVVVTPPPAQPLSAGPVTTVSPPTPTNRISAPDEMLVGQSDISMEVDTRDMSV
jgi:hypothetical protein